MVKLSPVLSEVLSSLEEIAMTIKNTVIQPTRLVMFENEIRRIRDLKPQETKLDLLPTERKLLTETWLRVKADQQFADLTRRELRDCISIEDIFRDPALLALIQEKSAPGRRMLRMLMRSYLSFWGKLGNSRLQWSNFIRQSLANPELDRLNWPTLGQWRKNASWLLSENAPEQLAQVLLEKVGTLPEVAAEFLDIESSSETDSLLDCTRRKMLDHFIHLEVDKLVEKLDQALTHWVKPTQDHEWLSQLILRIGGSGDNDAIERVKTWFLKADDYGDLRLHPHGNWRYISKEAQAIFNNWLSKEDLEFFFKMILPERDDPQGRRQFWEFYLPCVIRSRVLISDEDKRQNRQALNQMDQVGKTLPGPVKGSSLFIMETKSCYIVEFAETGNAAYVYWKKESKHYPELHDCLQRLLKYEILDWVTDKRLKLGRQVARLSNSDDCSTEYSITCYHTGGWQQSLKRWLTRRGIRPEIPVEPN